VPGWAKNLWAGEVFQRYEKSPAKCG